MTCERGRPGVTWHGVAWHGGATVWRDGLVDEAGGVRMRQGTAGAAGGKA